MNYQLSNATDADSDFVYEVKKIVLKEYVEQTWQRWDEDFQKRFHKENYSIANTKIIKVDEEPVGTVDVKDDAKSIFISGLYILPVYQNKSIGTRVLHELLAKAQIESKRLLLEVLQVNTKAQRLYTRLGFKMVQQDDKKFFMCKDFSEV